MIGLTSAVAAAPAAGKLVLQKVGEHRLLTGRYGAAAVAHGHSIYIIAGADAGGAVTDIERFDLRTQKSERVKDGLLPRRYLAATEFDGKIYLIGGQGYGLPGQFGIEPAVEIYDLATNQLSRGADLPNPRFNAATVRLGDKVIVTGGARVEGGNLTHTNDTAIYDIPTNTWSKGVPMPTPREAQGVLVDSFVIVAGGYRGTARVAAVEFFVPQENAWKSLPPLATKVSAHSLVRLGKHLLLFGDYSNLRSVLAYDLSTRRSQAVQASFTGARHTAAVVHDNVAYVIGGATNSDGTALDLIQAFAVTDARDR